jgi:hypothetical protein
MKRSSPLTALSRAALACALCAGALFAQAGPPVATKQLSSKPIWFKAEVVHFDQNSIVVRQVGNELDIRTFTYAASAQPQVTKALAKGGFQYGDKIRIRYTSGGSVALSIRGKPSKASKPLKTPAPPLEPRRQLPSSTSAPTSPVR